MNRVLELLRHHGQALALGFVFIIALAGSANMISAGVRGTDDSLLFYMSGLNIVHKAEIVALNNRAINHFKQKGQTRPHAMKRLILHRDYLNEYALPGVIYYGVSRAIKTLFDPLPQLYPIYLAQSIIFGFAASFIFSLGLLIWIFRAIKRPIFSWALMVTVSIYVFLFFLPMNTNVYANIMLHETIWGMAKNIFELLVHPSSQFSPLSFTPRSHFALLLIAVFALRWSDRYFWSYILLGVLSFIHLSASGIILTLLFAMDLVLRPHIFRRPFVSLAVFAAGMNFALRESMFDDLVGTSSHNLFVASVVVILGLGFSVVVAIKKAPGLYQALFGPKSIYAMTQKWLLARGTIAADLILLPLAWLASAIITYVVIQQLNLELFEPWFKAFYFWGRISGRLLTAIAPSMLFGICLLIFSALVTREGWFKQKSSLVFPSIAAAILGIIVWQGATNNVMPSKVMPLVASDFFTAEEHIKRGAMPVLVARNYREMVLFYAISKAIDGHPQALNFILR